MSSRTISCVLAGGGTGGHVIPAIAVAEEIVLEGGQVRFIGLRDRIEARLVPQAGFGIEFIRVRPLTGGGMGHIALGLASVPAAVLRSIYLLSRLKPDVVLGVGGYVAGPVVLAAKIKGIPTALLEQNATVGITNRLLARLVDRAFVSYKETVKDFPPGKAELTGNPVSRSIREAALVDRKKQADGIVRIVVMGGSQGARAIDERVPAAMALAGLKDEVTVLHQCGGGRMNEVRAAYRDAQINAEVVSFIEDMAKVYAEADLVVARSGATTVSELTVMGLPAVFLPYPHHTDRQQERNAEPMKRAGAAIVLDEKLTGIHEIADSIKGFVNDVERRHKAGESSASLGYPDAAKRVVEELLELRRGRP